MSHLLSLDSTPIECHTSGCRVTSGSRVTPSFTSRTPWAEDTELVAFRVRHDNPRLFTLADVDTLRAMSLKASHLCVLIIRPEVEMQPALGLLGLI